jgi:hypothetical protein
MAGLGMSYLAVCLDTENNAFGIWDNITEGHSTDINTYIWSKELETYNV